MGGGDVAVMLDDKPAGEALMKFLATPEAAEVWAGLGGYISPNKNVDISAYTDRSTSGAAQALVTPATRCATTCPTSSRRRSARRRGRATGGSSPDFLSDPSDVDGTAQQLEAAAKAAYKQEG